MTNRDPSAHTASGKHSSLLVIVPAFNEQASIVGVISDLKSCSYDVLVVDDGSTDSTVQRATGAGAIVLSLPINLGVGGALRSGFRYAVEKGYTRVVQVDGDGQHPVNQIQDLESAANRYRADLVIGSRYLSKSSTLSPSVPRRFVMWSLSTIATRVSGTRLTDTTSGFRLISEPLLSEFARQFPDYYLGDTYQATVSAIRAKYKVVEVPASLSQRQHGKSSVKTLRAVTQIAKVVVVTLGHLSPRLQPRPAATAA